VPVQGRQHSHIDLVNVENEIKLANVLKLLVQRLDEDLHIDQNMSFP
jgi:hypothetical protein